MTDLLVSWHREFDRALMELASEAVTPLTPSQILGQAADLLESGWCRGALIKNPSSPIKRQMCSVGAINMVSLGSENGVINVLNKHNQEARRQAFGYLADLICPDHEGPWVYAEGCVMSWNDEYGQRADEVIYTFRLAEKTAVSKGE